jgi:hypothetical protein
MWSLAIQGELQGIWFWAATYTFLVCSYSTTYQIRIRKWPRVVGSLDNATISPFGYTKQNPAEQEYRARARYFYRVSNQNYEGHRVSPWIILTNNNLRSILKRQLSAIDVDATGKVHVLYNPNRPSKSFLLPPSKVGIWFTFTLGALPYVAYLHRYYL